MTIPPEHLTAFADRIRRGRHEGITLGEGMIRLTKELWRDDRYRQDAQAVIDAFPESFPLVGSRSAD